MALTQRGRVGVWPLPLPMVDMVTIGAGGGSIARIENGALLVGPISAGSRPGPACYGAGGTAATVTDAHVVLGASARQPAWRPHGVGPGVGRFGVLDGIATPARFVAG